jgi:hypothetical protein
MPSLRRTSAGTEICSLRRELRMGNDHGYLITTVIHSAASPV